MNNVSTAAVTAQDEDKHHAHEWALLIQRLIKAVDAHHAGITNARKREGLTRALMVRDPSPEALRGKLTRLVESWGLVSDGFDTPEIAELPSSDNVVRTASEHLNATVKHLESTLQRGRPLEPGVIEKMRDLLMLLLENIAQLTPESHLLEQQIDQLSHMFSLPLTVRRLEEAERQLRSLMIKQGAIKHGIEEAKSATKEMVANLITRLGVISDSTGGYGKKVEQYAKKIREARDLPEVSGTVKQLLDDTRSISTDMAKARDDLVESRRRLREQQDRVVSLEQELSRVSAMVKTDPLTDTLNRRGFEEAYSQEVSRADRQGNSLLSIALLDVDNFKQLNDKMGHEAGDLALKHLAAVLRETLRPTDAVGRYGGEEFALLLPGVDVPTATEIMVRVQRELTKRIFLHENTKVLITFSAGVADVDISRGLAEALKRCDAAMYVAKKEGKNRVKIAVLAQQSS